jgi:tetratricopeptide (TPR) repeat protein
MSQTTTAPQISLHQLSLYNVGRMPPAQVIAAFAARRQQLDRIFADLSAETPKSRAQHHLIVGQRGMGKTMLLARVAAELRTDTDLSARFIPLVFAEEQYAVDRLSRFWLNCLDSLADARELALDTRGVAEIDATVARLTAAGLGAARDDQPFADEVYAAFVTTTRTLGRRPVLLVDNLQLVFERLDNGQQHSLRETLMRPGSPILIGACPSPPPQSQDYGAAFYDQFKVHYLRPLDESEMRSLLVQLAVGSGRDDVRQRVLEHRARLTVLRQLTGGNPRTALTLFFLYAEDFSPSVFGDLEGLLDRVTPLYKARFEELTAQQQVVASAIANHWDPVTAARLAAATGLPPGTISAQLDRLEKTGVVERTDLFGETSNGYQLAERFFNIWFLMRSASRRQRREVEFLTRFLESFYEPADRTRLARHLLEEDHFTPDRYVWSRAVAASLDEPDTAEELIRHVELTALREGHREARARLRELLDIDRPPPATLAFDDLRKKLMSLVPDDADITRDQFAKAVLGDRTMFMTGEREQLAASSGKLNNAEIELVLETTRRARTADEQDYTAEAVAWFSERLTSGQVRALKDAQDWNRAFHQAPDRHVVRLMVNSLPQGFGSFITDSCVTRISSMLRPTAEGTGWAWSKWGDGLVRLARYAEAEGAYRQAIARDSRNAWHWASLGHLLRNHLLRYAEAETAYREAIAREPEEAWFWFGLGRLLQEDPHRYLDAEAAYRKAIECDPRSPYPWNGLGRLLHRHLRRYDDAEAAYREAIACDSRSALSWNGLGCVLHYSLQRDDEAEIAYRQAIVRDPIFAAPRLNLGELQLTHARYAEAETAFREAIAIVPTNPWPWYRLGDLYGDYLNRPSEAAEAYDNALRFDPANEGALHGRLFLRRDLMGEGSDACQLMDELRLLPNPEFPDTRHLHEGLFAAYNFNWGLVCEALAKALAIRSHGFSSANTDDWLRTSAVLLHLNYGADLMTFFDQRGNTARLRPWVEALRAHHLGDRRALQNIAPEIRSTAEVFYDGIQSRLQKLPEKTRRRPLTKPKRTRRRRR